MRVVGEVQAGRRVGGAAADVDPEWADFPVGRDGPNQEEDQDQSAEEQEKPKFPAAPLLLGWFWRRGREIRGRLWRQEVATGNRHEGGDHDRFDGDRVSRNGCGVIEDFWFDIPGDTCARCHCRSFRCPGLRYLVVRLRYRGRWFFGPRLRLLGVSRRLLGRRRRCFGCGGGLRCYGRLRARRGLARIGRLIVAWGRTADKLGQPLLHLVVVRSRLDVVRCQHTPGWEAHLPPTLSLGDYGPSFARTHSAMPL